MFVANIYIGLQFCGKAALKRRITLSYQYRASEASEGKIHDVFFFFFFFFFFLLLLLLFFSPKNINIKVNR